MSCPLSFPAPMMAATTIPETLHIPVMAEEVLAALNPMDGAVYVDGTFGAGGYTTAILEAADCRVIGIDRDPSALALGEPLQKKYGDRLTLVRGCFGDVAAILRGLGIEKVDGFVLDLGVSSMQIDEAERGFSFRFDGPLDMRMDQQGGGVTAADIVNGWKENDLADLIYKYGEERHSRRIAKAIVEARAKKRIERTGELAEIVRKVVPRSFRDKIDPATRTFQALRIAVNGELDELKKALEAAPDILKPGGRLVVVSFHSLEDRIVKEFMAVHSGAAPRASRHRPDAVSAANEAIFDLPSRKAVFPSEAEAKANPRARSARLRYAIRRPLGGKGDGTP